MGKLIVIEGLDGSGKATQTEILLNTLLKEGIKALKISFPNYSEESSALVKMYLGGELGGLGDVNAYGASLFYAVDRYASFLRHWKKDYDEGAVILADRYATSNIPHQMSKLPRGEWDSFLKWLAELEYEKVKIPRPDRVIYLDMAPETSRRLISSRYGGDEKKRDIHEADFNYLLKCREAALYGAEKEGWSVIECCDGENPLPIEEIAERVLRAALPAVH